MTGVSEKVKPWIALMTAAGQGNLGDELILLQEIRLLQESRRISGISVFTHNMEETKKFLDAHEIDREKIFLAEYFPNNIRRKPFRNILNFLTNFLYLGQADVLMIGGGGLLYDATSEGGKRPIKHWTIRAFIANISPLKLVYWALGVDRGALRQKETADTLFDSASCITVRDHESARELEEYDHSCRVIPDPVFTYTPDSSGGSRSSDMVGLAIRSKGIAEDHMHDMVEHLAQAYDVHGIAHSIHPDNDQLNDHVFLKKAMADVSESMSESLDLYEHVGYVITNRLHSMILCCVYGIPFLPIVANQKTQSLVDDIGDMVAFDPEKDNFPETWKRFLQDANLPERIRVYGEQAKGLHELAFQKYLTPHLGDFS